jgi:hypothetical protein
MKVREAMSREVQLCTPEKKDPADESTEIVWESFRLISAALLRTINTFAMDFDSGIVDHRDEAALAKIFLPRFRNIDGKTLCDGKSLVTIVHWLAGWMRQSVLIHQIKMKFPVATRHPGPSPQCTFMSLRTACDRTGDDHDQGIDIYFSVDEEIG